MPIRHSNADPASSAANSKAGVSLAVTPDGPAVIVVFGGVASPCQLGLVSAVGPDVRRTAAPAAAGMVKIRSAPSRLPRKVIWEPSGEKAGSRSAPASLVRRVTDPPVGLIV